MDDAPQLTIGEVARRAGVATSSIRYYESIGLLPERGRLHGQRRYGPEVLGRLAFVDVAQNAGFKLEEIKQLMRAVDGADGMADQVRALSHRKLAEVEEMLERTQAMKGWLKVANACDCESSADCSLFPAPGEAQEATDALRIVHVQGHCRRVQDPAARSYGVISSSTS